MKGFTLMELLVVILMIGILSAVAMPQYQKTVEKARATEAVLTGKAIQEAVLRHVQRFPNDTSVTKQPQIADVNLTGGTWKASDCETNAATADDRQCFVTKHFTYNISDANAIKISRKNEGSTDTLYEVKLYPIRQEDGEWVQKSDATWTDCMASEYASACKLFDA